MCKTYHSGLILTRDMRVNDRSLGVTSHQVEESCCSVSVKQCSCTNLHSGHHNAATEHVRIKFIQNFKRWSQEPIR
jgi:hypothetical protein